MDVMFLAAVEKIQFVRSHSLEASHYRRNDQRPLHPTSARQSLYSECLREPPRCRWLWQEEQRLHHRTAPPAGADAPRCADKLLRVAVAVQYLPETTYASPKHISYWYTGTTP